MITVAKIDLAIAEAERFIRAARAAKKRLEDSYGGPEMGAASGKKGGDDWAAYSTFSSMETGTARRASMDLTRALATLRRRAS